MTSVTKEDILLAYDCANWFFKNRPDNQVKKAEEYEYNQFHLALPFYTMPFDLENRVLFKDEPSGVNGFTAVYKNRFILAFDSSDSSNDWKTNFLYRQMHMPYESHKSSLVKMHSGYANGWMKVRDQVHAAFKTSGLKELLVCGYSMGGGVAPIAALDIQYNFNVPTDMVRVVIGDGPRVFNFDGTIKYNKRIPNTIRVKWGNDLVTKLPMPWLGFYHIGQELHFGPTERWWKFSLLAHDPARGSYNSIMYRLPDGPVDPSWLSYHR